jgi:hypothetical protein
MLDYGMFQNTDNIAKYRRIYFEPRRLAKINYKLSIITLQFCDRVDFSLCKETTCAWDPLEYSKFIFILVSLATPFWPVRFMEPLSGARDLKYGCVGPPYFSVSATVPQIITKRSYGSHLLPLSLFYTLKYTVLYTVLCGHFFSRIHAFHMTCEN